jgi:hypothetical protein
LSAAIKAHPEWCDRDCVDSSEQRGIKFLTTYQRANFWEVEAVQTVVNVGFAVSKVCSGFDF